MVFFVCEIMTCRINEWIFPKLKFWEACDSVLMTIAVVFIICSSKICVSEKPKIEIAVSTRNHRKYVIYVSFPWPPVVAARY